MSIRNPSVTDRCGIVDYRCEACPALTGDELIVFNDQMDVSPGCRNSFTTDYYNGDYDRGCKKGLVGQGLLVLVVLKTHLG